MHRLLRVVRGRGVQASPSQLKAILQPCVWLGIARIDGDSVRV